MQTLLCARKNHKAMATLILEDFTLFAHSPIRGHSIFIENKVAYLNIASINNAFIYNMSINRKAIHLLIEQQNIY